MILVQLAAVPNQSLSITVDNNIYDISIQQMQGKNIINNSVVISVNNVLMAASISRNNIPLITGARITPGIPLLPYFYLEEGNFIILTTGNDSFIDPETMDVNDPVIIPCGSDYPDYQQFGITQFLYYASNAELAAVRLANSEAFHGGA